MSEIYIQCEYTILKKENRHNDSEDFKFYKHLDDIEIEVKISFKKTTAIAKITGATLDDNFITELQKLDRFDGDQLSGECKSIIYRYTHAARNFTKEILNLIKYHLYHYVRWRKINHKKNGINYPTPQV